MPVGISTEESMHQLATAVLKVAVEQWKYKRMHTPDRQEMIRFFMSDTFDLFCDLAHVDPEWLLGELGIKWRYKLIVEE